MKHTILFLAANPRDTDQLALQEECAAIERELRMASGRDEFELRSRWAVGVDDLMRHLNELSPTVLHFSGHGTHGIVDAPRALGASHRDIGSMPGAGILLQNRDSSQYVGERALASMIASASPSTRLVVLNACYSAAIAEALRQVVDCVIGIEGAIEDVTARSFAVGFYRALAHRRSVGNAVAQAAATLDAKQQPAHLAVCHTRDGLSADQILLASPDPRPESGELRMSDAGVDIAGRGSELPRAGSWSTAAAAEYHDVFLAHPSANKSTACALYDLLQPDIRVFLAGRSVGPSDRWDLEILAAQRASRASVLMISLQSDAAWYLGAEIITAISLHRASPDGHWVVPVLLEPGITVPCSLSHVAVIDASAIGGLAGVAARLREYVAEMRRQISPLSSASGPPSSEPSSGVRVRRDHFRLYDRLGQLTDTVFEQVVSHAGIEREMLAPRTSALAQRALDVAQLAALDPALGRRVSAELDRRAPWTRR